MSAERPAAGGAAPPGEYWDRDVVAERFAALAPPAYLVDLIPAGGPSGALALDAGCGGGRNLRLLTERGYRYVALDLHPAMIRKVRELALPGGVAVQGAVTAIPLPDCSVSAVVCHGVLHNLTTAAAIRRALEELRRVAKAGALASLNLFSGAHLDPCLRPLGDEVYALENGQRMTLLAPAEIARLCRRSGWRIDDGPHEYLSPGDPGLRSVWRAAMVAV